MALKITDECINCDVCEPVCPNQAISMGIDIYVIDPMRCTECAGHFDQPQCQQVCPVECIPLDPDHLESSEQLWKKYRRLSASKEKKMPYALLCAFLRLPGAVFPSPYFSVHYLMSSGFDWHLMQAVFLRLYGYSFC